MIIALVLIAVGAAAMMYALCWASGGPK